MKIAILGFGKQGRSAFDYWQSPDNQLTICDTNSELQLPNGVEARLGSDYLKNLDEFDLIVRSPSIHPKDIVDQNTKGTLSKVTTITNEFLRVCPSKNIVGVTGTKGKGTTSTLIAKILEADGQRVHLGGNIGTPPLDMLKNDIQPDDWVVLELANFQLFDIKYSPKIAVCLMVAPEHLDWHPDTDEYFVAKRQLFAHQTTKDIAIYYSENEISKEIASASPGKIIPYYKSPGAHIENENVVINGQTICSTGEIKLLGKHNWQNVCAAVTAVWQITQNIEAIKSVITSFSGMEHRLELVRELNGVKYYDDSFGTTPETAIVAIEAFNQPKIVILGGKPKGTSFDQLAQTVKDGNVKRVIAIGEAGFEIMQSLTNIGYTGVVKGEKDMNSIVKQAQDLAEPGDIVLLSPACASFDMFKNYEDRGQQFKQAVQALV